ncbi:metallophosphoesterase family protein [Caballeronia sordidicola]|uniref:Calcineurin-like phosphoesterase domain-containing protein n=1 Tax=Caballeronia sordidicola TaxID=196367 RepID=A0A226WRH9_CABSO|nr:metallophosphoesterase [Caballeronia sordidicola]OXC73407.1 hypothetical protein BSU04_37055 [Caballeronia sordidicola]
MIECILNHDFVLRNAHAALEELNTPIDEDDRRGLTDDPLDKFTEAERNEVADALRAALGREKLAVSYSGSSERAPAVRGQEAPLMDWAFVSHDAIISIVQSALDEHLRSIENAVTQAPPEPDDDRRAAETRIPVSNEGLEALVARRDDDDRRVFDAFSQTDPRWVASLIAKGITMLKGKHPFPADPAPALNIAENARVIMIGDWATGLPRATDMASNVIQRWIDEAAGRERHVIHLGDVYYSGWPEESKKHLLDPWPVKTGQEQEIKSWCLNGNHDMFSGGIGYFDTILSDTRFRNQNGSSRFELRHPKWQILGLDSAYEDNSLDAGGQVDWVLKRLTDATDSGRKNLLLSHHQLFSAYESGSEKMAAQMHDALSAGLIRSWFWGHEHRCAIYKPFMGVEYARCIGHGGVPVYQWRKVADPVNPPASYEFRGSFTTPPGIERWADFGFVVLDFDANGTIRAYYVDETGNAFYGAQQDGQGRLYEEIN